MRTDELFERFLQSRIEQHMAVATINWYRYTLRSWGNLQLEAPTRADVSRWLGTAPSAESARTWRRALKAMYSWAAEAFGLEEFAERGILVSSVPNPTVGIKPPPRKTILPRVFTDGELYLIRSKCQDLRDVAMVTVLLDTGMRLGQLHSMRWERIEASPTEPGAYTALIVGKTGDHYVPMSPESYHAVRAISGRPGPVFRTIKGTPLAKGTINIRVRDVIEAAGVTGKKVGPHTFRHTFATLYLRRGGDIHRLQRLLGHSSISQTMVYLHLSDPDAHSEHARLSPLRFLNEPRQIPLEEASG